MKMNVQGNINKILIAIRIKGVDIKIDRIEFYSEKTKTYCTKYSVYVKEDTEDRYGNPVRKYELKNEFFNKVPLLLYLVDYYKNIVEEGETDE